MLRGNGLELDTAFGMRTQNRTLVVLREEYRSESSIYPAMLCDALGPSIRQSLDEACRPCTYRPVKQNKLFFLCETGWFCCFAVMQEIPLPALCEPWFSAPFPSAVITSSSLLHYFPSRCRTCGNGSPWLLSSCFFKCPHHPCKTFSESIVMIARKFLVNGHFIRINDVIFLCFT